LIKKSNAPVEQIFEQLKSLVENFRRLKFRVEKRHTQLAKSDMAFPEHYVFDQPPQ
jgi:hypothetical protein